MAIGALVLLAAGCGGANSSSDNGDTTGSTTPTTEVTTAPTTEVTEPSPQASDLDTATFQMPSGNIGCAIGGGALRCDILSGLRPEPTEECELDWVGVSIPAEGMPGPNCAGDTAFDTKAPVLEYGETWSRGGVVCESSERGLRCTNTSGNAFLLSRESWEIS